MTAKNMMNEVFFLFIKFAFSRLTDAEQFEHMFVLLHILTYLSFY
jgi:hypothetical protein